MGVIVGLAPVIFTTASVFQHRGGYFFLLFVVLLPYLIINRISNGLFKCLELFTGEHGSFPIWRNNYKATIWNMDSCFPKWFRISVSIYLVIKRTKILHKGRIMFRFRFIFHNFKVFTQQFRHRNFKGSRNSTSILHFGSNFSPFIFPKLNFMYWRIAHFT